MATLTIKNFPDELYAELKARAAEHRRSLNAEAIVCVEQALGAAPADAAATLDALRHARRRVKGLFLTDRTLRAGRRAGRA